MSDPVSCADDACSPSGQRTLVLGEGSPILHPETHVLAGPWPLAGFEQELPEPEAFTMLPEVFADPERLNIALRQADELMASMSRLIADELGTRYGLKLSTRYWDAALAPWLCLALEILVDRLHRTEALLATFGETPLRVPLLHENPCPTFATSLEVQKLGAQNPRWNHWIFSEMLRECFPAAWTAEKALPPLLPLTRDAAKPAAESGQSAGQDAGQEASLSERVRALIRARVLPLARSLARRILFALPFPRIKGFSTGQSLRLSLALLLNRRTEDRTIPLSVLGQPRDGVPAPPLPLGWTAQRLLPLLMQMLPTELVAHLPRQSGGRAWVRTRVVSIAAYDDDAYRARVARWREAGCRLIYIQHGCDYGYVRSAFMMPMVEYSQHAFFTWGWTRHGAYPGNCQPLPHAQLAALRGSHREVAPDLFFVGTEMVLVPYTLKSCRRTTQVLAYRRDKARFLTALPPGLCARTLYRPYFKVPCALSDAEWLLPRFPTLRRHSGPLEPQLAACRLLVLDHLGTTLAQALACDTPSVVFRNPTHCPLTREADELVAQLRAVGIVHDSPESAAEHIARIWDDVPGWWNSTPVRAASKAWADQHALTVPGDVTPIWAQALQRI